MATNRILPPPAGTGNTQIEPNQHEGPRPSPPAPEQKSPGRALFEMAEGYRKIKDARVNQLGYGLLACIECTCGCGLPIITCNLACSTIMTFACCDPKIICDPDYLGRPELDTQCGYNFFKPCSNFDLILNNISNEQKIVRENEEKIAAAQQQVMVFGPRGMRRGSYHSPHLN